MQRRLSEGAALELGALSELPHPIIEKALESFGEDPGQDAHRGPIQSSKVYRLWELRAGQWRGGVWRDPDTGVNWLIFAGLAKNHLSKLADRDDVYQVVERAQATGEAHRWLPTDEDRRLLKAETASRITLEWELEVQKQVSLALDEVKDGGSSSFSVAHPLLHRFEPPERIIATVTLTVSPVRESGYHADEILVEMSPGTRWAGSHLVWQLVTRVMISLEPPEQGWDTDGLTFCNIGDPGSWRSRSEVLHRMVSAGELGQSVPGAHSHYAHRLHLAGQSIEGRGVRGLCGVFFVPHQDHENRPMCPQCTEEFARLPNGA